MSYGSFIFTLKRNFARLSDIFLVLYSQGFYKSMAYIYNLTNLHVINNTVLTNETLFMQLINLQGFNCQWENFTISILIFLLNLLEQ